MCIRDSMHLAFRICYLHASLLMALTFTHIFTRQYSSSIDWRVSVTPVAVKPTFPPPALINAANLSEMSIPSSTEEKMEAISSRENVTETTSTKQRENQFDSDDICRTIARILQIEPCSKHLSVLALLQAARPAAPTRDRLKNER